MNMPPQEEIYELSPTQVDPSSTVHRAASSFLCGDREIIFHRALWVFMGLFGGIVGYCFAVLPAIESHLQLNSILGGLLISSIFIGLSVGIVFAAISSPYLGPIWSGGAIILTGCSTVLTWFIASLSEKPVLGQFNLAPLCDEKWLNGSSKAARAEFGESHTGLDILFGLALYFIGAFAAIPLVTAVKKTAFHTGQLPIFVCAGPFVGLLVGAYLQTNPPSYPFSNGFLLQGSAVLFVGFFVCAVVRGFPRMWGYDETTSTVQGITNTVKDIGGKCGMLLKNLAYLGILATILADALSTSVLLTIFPRYLQIYFDVSVVNSNFATACSLVLPFALSACCLFYAKRWFRPDTENVSTISIICAGLSCLGFLILIFLKCDVEHLDFDQVGSLKAGHIVLTNICNDKCDCKSNARDLRFPVCHEETGVTFATPCHAGCLSTAPNNRSFGHCECVLNRQKDDQLPADVTFTVPGLCPRKCGSGLILVAFLATVMLTQGGFPLFESLQRITRVVLPEDVATTKILTLFLVAVFALSTSPVLAGWLLTFSCEVWGIQNGDDLLSHSICAAYDHEKMRTNTHISFMLAKALVATTYLSIKICCHNSSQRTSPSAQTSAIYRRIDAGSIVNLIPEEM